VLAKARERVCEMCRVIDMSTLARMQKSGRGDRVTKGWIVPALEGFPGENLMNINIRPHLTLFPSLVPINFSVL
jgi:hypothetical protein